jgi:vancomycin permeability regulator SanA
MFFLISKLLSFIITPVVWMAALLIVAIISKDAKRRKKFLIAGLIVCYVFTNDFLLDTCMRFWEVPAIHDEEIKEKYDVGIVLGGMIEYDTELKRPQFKQDADRLFQALTLYKKGKIRKILIDGGSGSLTEKDIREGPILKAYLLQLGIPDSVIAIEPNSKNPVKMHYLQNQYSIALHHMANIF